MGNSRNQAFLETSKNEKTLKCIIPARNEAGNIRSLIEDIVTIKEIDVIVVVEGGSIDGTFEIAIDLSKKYPDKIHVMKQSGKGKFNAVLEGAKSIDTDFSMIWDADGTVPVDSTRLLIELALRENTFTIGDRLRGNMEPGAMQHFNKIGNWFFAALWAPINRIKPTDVFCGTKIGPSKIFLDAPKAFIELDPYGDLCLLLSSRSHGIKVNALPVNYYARKYGESKMRRWKVGLEFLKITLKSYLLVFIRKMP